MPEAQPKSGPDLLALAMRRARTDVAEGRVPRRSPDAAEDSAKSRTRLGRVAASPSSSAVSGAQCRRPSEESG